MFFLSRIFLRIIETDWALNEIAERHITVSFLRSFELFSGLCLIILLSSSDPFFIAWADCAEGI